ncbi:hypothetical protein DFQ28_011247 [Apophysomyces sp. BC1034]|nr:hypothetical protein DFQ28_011247 [Apophysomyces sp. BC1034]
MAKTDIPDHLHVGSRIQVQHDRATIRFLGSVVRTTGLWLGVEWDDPTRGKHDGTHEGVQYFECSSPTSGSFLRYHPDKVQLGQSFLEALSDKYLDDSTGTDEYDASKDIGHVYFGGNRQLMVETVGFDKVQRQQRHLNTLTIVGLAEQLIANAGPEKAISDAGLILEDLDLSRNLLPDWETIADIVSQLPHLRILRLKQTLRQRGSVFENLTTLALNNTRTKWHDIEMLAPLLTYLEDLQLGGNQINQLSALTTLKQLKCINLEDNKIDSWDQVEKLGSLPRSVENGKARALACVLETMYLLNNQISTVSFPAADALNHMPGLKRLRCKGNPVFQDMDVELATAHIVGHIKGLTVVNGNTMTAQERTDYERYYLKLCAKEGQTHKVISAQHPRYEELCQLHGEPDLGETTKSAMLKDRLMGITLSHRTGTSDTLMVAQKMDELPAATKTVEKKVLATMLIRNLRHIIQKLFRIPAQRQQLFLVQANGSGVLVMDLTDDLRDLKFYCISAGDEIVVLDGND